MGYVDAGAPLGWRLLLAVLEGVAVAAPALLAAAAAATLASFLGVVVDRVPAGESLGGASRCVCGARVAARDNVPVLGWVARGGRARCCGAAIPRRYVVAEAAAAAVAAVVAAAAGGGWVAVATGAAAGAAAAAVVLLTAARRW